MPIELNDARALDSVYLYGNDLIGTLDPVFCMETRLFDELIVDCQGPNPQINCTCCTHCCNPEGLECRESTQSTPQTSPTIQPDTEAADSRFAQLQELLETVSGPDKLRDDNSHQYAAAKWMAQSDPTPLDLNSTSPQTIVQEYVIVLLYLATQGEHWKKQKSFLTATSVCNWEGISCAGGDMVTALALENNNMTGTLVSTLPLRNRCFRYRKRARDALLEVSVLLTRIHVPSVFLRFLRLAHLEGASKNWCLMVTIFMVTSL